MEEIQKEIKINEKYLTDVVSDHERLRRAREMKNEQKKCKFVAYQKNQIELKEFVKSKQSLLMQLVGSGQKKDKVKDMSLGSESTQF